MNLAIFLFVLLGNIWIWKIFSLNLLIGLSLVLTSCFLYKSIKDRELNKFLILFLFVLLVFQYRTTQKVPLDYLSEQEKIMQTQRTREYPPVYIKMGDRTIWIPAYHWLEERKETLAFYRIEKNISESLSPNLYFFANHPNERVGVKEFEKFPYILLPFFVIGFLNMEARKNIKIIILSLLTPIVLVSLIGDKNLLGPFSLFPFIVVDSVLGTEYVYKIFFKRILVGSFLFAYILVFLQTILYERF